MSGVTTLVLIGAVMFAVLGGVTLLAHIYSLNNIKSRTVGDGQNGTARWATEHEIRKTYRHIPFTPERWREQAKRGEKPTTIEGAELPQGIIVGCIGNTTAMVDTGDVHALMIGAAGVGETAYWLYPCPVSNMPALPVLAGSPPIPKAISCETTGRSPKTMAIMYR